jgi:hypothetical protein
MHSPGNIRCSWRASSPGRTDGSGTPVRATRSPDMVRSARHRPGPCLRPRTGCPGSRWSNSARCRRAATDTRCRRSSARWGTRHTASRALRTPCQTNPARRSHRCSSRSCSCPYRKPGRPRRRRHHRRRGRRCRPCPGECIPCTRCPGYRTRARRALRRRSASVAPGHHWTLIRRGACARRAGRSSAPGRWGCRRRQRSERATRLQGAASPHP